MIVIEQLWKDLLGQYVFLGRALLLMPLLVIAFLYFRDHRGEAATELKKLLRQPWRIAFFFYLAFILINTVFSRTTTNPLEHVLSHFGFGADVNWNNQIIENILLFIPCTFFYLNAFPVRKPVRDAAVLSAALTLSVELCQLIFWLGEFQLSDLFHNFLGGMIGCGLWYLAGWLRRRLKLLWRQRQERRRQA